MGSGSRLLLPSKARTLPLEPLEEKWRSAAARRARGSLPGRPLGPAALLLHGSCGAAAAVAASQRQRRGKETKCAKGNASKLAHARPSVRLASKMLPARKCGFQSKCSRVSERRRALQPLVPCTSRRRSANESSHNLQGPSRSSQAAFSSNRLFSSKEEGKRRPQLARLAPLLLDAAEQLRHGCCILPQSVLQACCPPSLARPVPLLSLSPLCVCVHACVREGY